MTDVYFGTNLIYTLSNLERCFGELMGIQEKYFIHRSKSGDGGSFEKLVKKHYQVLFRFALSITKGNEDLASDVLQNALLKAFLNIASFEGRSSFTSWLWVIIRNEFISLLRKESGEITGAESDISEDQPDTESVSVENSLMLEQRKENLLKVIDQLPENYREIVMMIEMSGMSYVEASEFLGVPVGSVKSRLSRAREELHRIIERNVELFS
jgi:RNA polymerase sigma-70 factor, ECF subfamily